MGTQKQIYLMIKSDANQDKIGTLSIAPRRQDTNHLQRRQQQRAINEAYIKICLLYGQKHHHKGALIFTLNDRTLKQTPYAAFTDVLRGLRVVCLNGLPNPQILTVYWHKETKRRVRK